MHIADGDGIIWTLAVWLQLVVGVTCCWLLVQFSVGNRKMTLTLTQFCLMSLTRKRRRVWKIQLNQEISGVMVMLMMMVVLWRRKKVQHLGIIILSITVHIYVCFVSDTKCYYVSTDCSFLARDSMLSTLYAIARPFVRLSVRHTGGSVENGWSYDRAIFTIQ